MELVLTMPIVIFLVVVLLIVSRAFLARQRGAVAARQSAWRYAQRNDWPDVRASTGNADARLEKGSRPATSPFPGLSRPFLGIRLASELGADARATVAQRFRGSVDRFRIDRELRSDSVIVKDLWIRPGQEGLGGFFPYLKWGWIPRGVPGFAW